MRIILQRVFSACAKFEEKIINEIKNGYILYIGFEQNDTEESVDKLVKKILNIRLFDGKSVTDMKYEVLCLSQFTLFCVFKGRKPDFHKAEKHERAKILYNRFCEEMEKAYNANCVKRGMFGERIKVEQVGDGPFTIILEDR